MNGIIRVMVRNMPPMLRDILENTLAGHADMRSIPDRRDAAPPDVVLVGSARASDDAASLALLGQWPSARIIAVDVGGRLSRMFELRPYRTDLGALSAEELVDAIRTAALAGGPPESRPVVSDVRAN